MVLSDFRSGALFGHFSGILKKIAFPKICFLAPSPRIVGSTKIFFANILVIHRGHHLPLWPSQKQGSQSMKCDVLDVENGFFGNNSFILTSIEPILPFSDSARRDASIDILFERFRRWFDFSISGLHPDWCPHRWFDPPRRTPVFLQFFSFDKLCGLGVL